MVSSGPTRSLSAATTQTQFVAVEVLVTKVGHESRAASTSRSSLSSTWCARSTRSGRFATNRSRAFGASRRQKSSKGSPSTAMP